MSQYFPKPFRSFGGNINVKVDISNYATKADIKLVKVTKDAGGKFDDYLMIIQFHVRLDKFYCIGVMN